MSLLSLHIELARTNDLLKRIADALDRAVPATKPPDHSTHPLIGIADISRMTPVHARELDENRDTVQYRASSRVFSSGSTPGPRADMEPKPTASVTGAWDHEDPLDDLEDLDHGWPNYAGVDR